MIHLEEVVGEVGVTGICTESWGTITLALRAATLRQTQMTPNLTSLIPVLTTSMRIGDV